MVLINIYLLPDDHPTWSGGLANGFGNSGGSAFVIGGNISFPGSGVQNMVPSKVLPHEMGHCLGLYHTFEELLCREKVSGSNCSSCGDLVCDTPAESPFYIFAENAACAYTTSTTDEDGATYSPILSNIMNYVRPSCMNAFTNGQGSRMRNAIALDPAISSTVASTAFYTGGVYSYGGSTFAINSSSTNISLNNSAKTATITLPNYGSNTIYNWTISNNNGSPSPEYTFLGNNAFLTLYGGNTLNVTCNVTAPCGSGIYNFSLYNYSSFRIVASPNPANQTLSINAKLVDKASKTSTDEQLFTTDNINNTSITLLDKNGKIVNSGKMVNEITSFNTEKLPNGTYYLHITGGKELVTKQIIIKH